MLFATFSPFIPVVILRAAATECAVSGDTCALVTFQFINGPGKPVPVTPPLCILVSLLVSWGKLFPNPTDHQNNLF